MLDQPAFYHNLDDASVRVVKSEYLYMLVVLLTSKIHEYHIVIMLLQVQVISVFFQ